MEANENITITVETTIDAPIGNVWKYWTEPRYIIHWNKASDDWHTTYAENNLQVNGKFLSRMEARDGSWGFDFAGTYTFIDYLKLIRYVMDDGRKVEVSFKTFHNQTVVTEIFEPENEHSHELQKAGWQAILDNFKKFAESSQTAILQFEIEINAPAEKVFRLMLEDKTYREWTVIFNSQSHYIGNWERGSKILFIGVGENGDVGGMVSRIKENIPNRYVSIEHIGLLKKDIEIFDGQEVEKWKGAIENYTFTETAGKTIVTVDLYGVGEFAEYFSEMWPDALKVLKNICAR
jgi:uncharacterized protein YndB with AHSA1/START domain